MATATALAALNDDKHALAVDVADLERRHLGDTQPCTIGDGESGAMLEAGRRGQQARDLVGAEHDREFARIAQADQLAGEVWPVDGVVKEEPQCSDGAVHRWRVHAALGLLDLEPTDVLGGGCARRVLQEGGEARDSADVIVAGLVGEPAHGHVRDEALT